MCWGDLPDVQRARLSPDPQADRQVHGVLILIALLVNDAVRLGDNDGHSSHGLPFRRHACEDDFCWRPGYRSCLEMSRYLPRRGLSDALLCGNGPWVDMLMDIGLQSPIPILSGLLRASCAC